MVYMFKLNYDYGVTSHEGKPLLFGRSFVFCFFFFFFFFFKSFV